MKLKKRNFIAILVAFVMCIGIIPISAVTANAAVGNYYYIDHVDIAKEDKAAALTVPSTASVFVTYSNGDRIQLSRNGESTDGSGNSQWRFTGLRGDGRQTYSYISQGNMATDSSGYYRVTSVYVSYVHNGKTYEYTLSDYSGLYNGYKNCPGHNGLDIAVLGSTKTNYYFYHVIYEYYTDEIYDGKDDTGNIVQTEADSVTLTPEAKKTYNGNEYNFDSERSDSYSNVNLSTSKNSPENPVVITLVYVRTAPAAQIGSLIVSKTVAGEDPDTTKEFTFTVTAKTPDGAGLSGRYGDMTFDENGTATFTLKHGERKVASDLPAGTTYSVMETQDDDYTSTSTGESGTIVAGESVTAAFTNTLKDSGIVDPEPEYGSLIVSKTVAGEDPDTTKEFTFTVTAKTPDGAGLSGRYGDMTFDENGTATFTLKHGERKVASDLPAGTTYSVVETQDDDYTSTSTGESGTIVAGESATAAFTNTLKDSGIVDPEPSDDPDEPLDDVPKTGDENSIGLWIVFACLSLFGMAALIFRRKHFSTHRSR